MSDLAPKLTPADMMIGYFLFHTGTSSNKNLVKAAKSASKEASNIELLKLYDYAANDESGIFSWANTSRNEREDKIVDAIGRKGFTAITLSAAVVEQYTPKEPTQDIIKLTTSNDDPRAYDALLNLCQNTKTKPLEDTKPTVVDMFNSTHSVVVHGSKTLISERVTDHKGNTGYTFSSVPQKKNLYLNLNFPYESTSGEDTKVKQANAFDVWMKDLQRQTYHGVVFDPSGKAGSQFLNMWGGFAVSPVKGDERLDRIMWHLLHIVCNGNQDHFAYLLAWLAHIVQKPEEKSGVCLVLKSEARGTGKSTVSVIMERLLGQHAMRVQDGKHLLGAFNSHLANKLFVTVEEAFWSGSNKDAGKLRTLITESTVTIEAKGKDAIEIDSYHRFMMATNNDWAVPQTADERRFFVLEVSEAKKQDPEYFADLYKDVNSDEAMGQLVNFLNEYDLTPYNLHKAPKTTATDSQIIESLPPEASWLQGLLDEGLLIDGGHEFELGEYKKAPKAAFFADYIAYCDKMNVQGYDRKKPITIGLYLKKSAGLFDGGKMPSNQGGGNAYSMTSIEAMRESFSQHYNVPIETMFS